VIKNAAKHQTAECQVPIPKQKQQQQHPFNGSLFGTTRVSQYQKGKNQSGFTEARNREW